MVDEVEVDLEDACTMPDRRCRQPSRGHVINDMPRMVDPWRLHQADLADDLGPELQGRAGLLPGGVGQAGPSFHRASKRYGCAACDARTDATQAVSLLA